MQTGGLIFWESGTGQNTVAVNLAIGLARRSKRVIFDHLEKGHKRFILFRYASAAQVVPKK